MKLVHLFESNAVARTNALKTQQELVDAGKKNIEVTKLPLGVYQLTIKDEKESWFCTPDGRVEEYSVPEGPFPVGEPMIATDAYCAYRYAKHVLKGRFSAGEKVIATDGEHSYFYANLVLKAPFPAGEPAIATDGEHAYLYALDVLKAPFPAGEPAIATDPEISYYYALHVLEGPFPAGEKVIMGSEYKVGYKKLLESLKK